MSFILDALKKSEAERQRQNGPTLWELRVTQPRRRYPAWAIVVAALLAVNVLVLLVFVLRRPAAAPRTAAAGAVAAAAAPASAPAAKSPATPPATATAAGVAAQAPVVDSGAPAAQVATLAAQAASLAAQAAAVAAQVRAPATAPGNVAPLLSVPTPPTPSSTAPPEGDAGTAATGSGNPADYLPAVPAAAGTAAPGGGITPQPPAVSDYSTLPSLGELGGNLPALQLNLLDYSDSPAQRYALINMHRVREGDVTAEGARVLAITRQGVALDYRGQRFMLRPAGTVQ